MTEPYDGPTFHVIDLTPPQPPTDSDGKPLLGTPCRKCCGETHLTVAGPGGWAQVCVVCGHDEAYMIPKVITVEEARRRFGP